MIDDYLLQLIRPPQKSGFITEEDLQRAENQISPLCDEGHLQVFGWWYQMGGLKRPLSPTEAAETPAPLAQDFIYLLKRMRELADDEVKLGEFVHLGIFKDPDRSNIFAEE